MGQTGRIPLLIVGGGIGGLATALAVSKTGRRVHVLERSQEFAELGAGLQLAPNALRVLNRLGIMEQVDKHAFYPRRLMLMDMLTGEEITSLELGLRFLDRYSYPYVVMHRGDLLNAELEACRASDLIVLEANKEVVAVQDLGDSVGVMCKDGSVYECEALVGADGLWSNMRTAICGESEPVCAEFVAYRGTAPIEDIPPHPGLDSMMLWIGPDKHFVQYKLRGGEICNQVAVFRSHRYRKDSDDWGSVEELEEHYAEACDYVRSALALIHRNRRWPMHDRPPNPQWTKNRMTLLGDAAHAMLQYVAQGACQALEDTACLADQLSQHGDDILSAFQAYRMIRFPRTAMVQMTARGFGEIIHAPGAPARIRAEVSKHSDNEFFYFDWLYR
jgi:2-polyprenyl-6-methoxyphenol hydroxylase-like FAD-dependent oxidoreductase